jgi:hypothetical protein
LLLFFKKEALAFFLLFILSRVRAPLVVGCEAAHPTVDRQLT